MTLPRKLGHQLLENNNGHVKIIGHSYTQNFEQITPVKLNNLANKFLIIIIGVFPHTRLGIVNDRY